MTDILRVGESQRLKHLVKDNGDSGLCHEALGSIVQDRAFQIHWAFSMDAGPH